MPTFKPISYLSQIQLPPSWKPAAKFNSQGKVVDKDGNVPTPQYQGTRYILVAKRERLFSCLERSIRGFLGVLATIATLGAAWFLSQSVRDNVKKNKETIRYGIPTTTQNRSAPAAIGVATLGSQAVTPSTPSPQAQTQNASGTTSPVSQTSSLPPIPAPIPPNPLLKTEPLFNLPNAEPLLSFEIEKFINGDPLPSVTSTFSASVIQQRIKDRLDLWDAAIQLKAQLKQYPNTGLTIRDLLQGSLSPLNYLFLPPTELEKMTIHDLRQPNTKLVDYLLQNPIRAAAAKRAGFDGSTETPFTISKISLADIPALKAVDINRLAPHLPPFVFCLLATAEIPLLDLNQLSELQLEVLLVSKNRAAAILPSQISQSLVPKLTAKQIANLSDQQILGIIDYSSGQFFKTLFASLSPVYMLAGKETMQVKTQRLSLQLTVLLRTKGLIQRLTTKQIEQYHRHFEHAHWGFLSDQQILDLVNTGTADQQKQTLQKLNLANLQRMSPFLRPSHWRALTPQQILQLDLAPVFATSRNNTDLSNFVAIFPESTQQTTLLIQKLDTNQLHAVARNFTKWHWEQVTDQQLSKLDMNHKNMSVLPRAVKERIATIKIKTTP